MANLPQGFLGRPGDPLIQAIYMVMMQDTQGYDVISCPGLVLWAMQSIINAQVMI
jgi:hypothetical protein